MCRPLIRPFSKASALGKCLLLSKASAIGLTPTVMLMLHAFAQATSNPLHRFVKRDSVHPFTTAHYHEVTSFERFRR